MPDFRGRRLALALAPPAGDAERSLSRDPRCAGQLRLNHAQLLLDDAEPEPAQASRLPDPAWFEADDAQPPRGGGTFSHFGVHSGATAANGLASARCPLRLFL